MNAEKPKYDIEGADVIHCIKYTGENGILTDKQCLNKLIDDRANIRKQQSITNEDYGRLCYIEQIYDRAIAILREFVKNSIPAKFVDKRIDVEAVKSKTDIISLIEGYGIILKKSGISWRGMCPFHNGKSPALAVYPDEQSWYCYSCNTGGDVITFIQKMEKVEFKEAVEKLS